MTIWTYNDESREVTKELLHRFCTYCHSQMTSIYRETRPNGWGVLDDPLNSITREIYACPCCGWWYVQENESERIIEEYRQTWRAACGVLRNLDLADLSIPLGEIRTYITAKYENRAYVNPIVFEEIVASVFRDLGYDTRVTAATADNGIDVILDGPKGDTVGVQVKRYRSKIKVEQIRSFAGALLLAGYTKGIFVTTSEYQSGAPKTAKRYAHRKMAIELYDANRFFSALKIAQRNAYAVRDLSKAPFSNCKLQQIDSRNDFIDDG